MVFGFAGGLTQTDWLGLTTGIAGTGYGVAAFNQGAYLGNVALQQAQTYQKKSYHLGFVSVARSDVFNIMNIIVARINNYMVVSTLILGVATAGLQSISFPPSAIPFVVYDFWVSMGISVVFFALSIMMAVKGQNSAFLNTMRLLTWEIKPENPGSYDRNFMREAQLFEKGGLRELLRLPGIGPSYPSAAAAPSVAAATAGKTSDSQKRRQGVRSASPPPRLSRLSEDGSTARSGMAAHQFEGHKGDTLLERAAKKKEQHDLERDLPLMQEAEPDSEELVYLARYGQFMQLWQPYDTQAKHCLALGLISLSQGISYYSLGMLVASQSPLSNMTAVLMVVLFSWLCMMVFALAFSNDQSVGSRFTVLAFYSIAPTTATVAALVDSPAWVRLVFAPCTSLVHSLMFLAAFAVSFTAYVDPAETVEKYREGPNGQKFPRRYAYAEAVAGYTTSASSSDASMSDSSDESMGHRDLEEGHDENEKILTAETRKTKRRVRSVVRFTLLFSGIVWAVVFVANIVQIEREDPVSLLWMKEMQTDQINVNWKFSSVGISSIACADPTQVFVADKYQVYRIDAKNGSDSILPCAVNGIIADISADCVGGSCKVYALVNGTSQTIVECASAVSEGGPLLQSQVPASRISIEEHKQDWWKPWAELGVNESSATLLVSHEEQLTEYQWNEQRSGWVPLRDIGTMPYMPQSIATRGRQVWLFEQMMMESGSGWGSNRFMGNVATLTDLPDLTGSQQFRIRGEPVISGCAASGSELFLLQGGKGRPVSVVKGLPQIS